MFCDWLWVRLDSERQKRMSLKVAEDLSVWRKESLNFSEVIRRM
jgi:hypothetical protein